MTVAGNLTSFSGVTKPNARVRSSATEPVPPGRFYDEEGG